MRLANPLPDSCGTRPGMTACLDSAQSGPVLEFEAEIDLVPDRNAVVGHQRNFGFEQPGVIDGAGTKASQLEAATLVESQGRAKVGAGQHHLCETTMLRLRSLFIGTAW